MFFAKNLAPYFKDFAKAMPFSHCVVDNFLPEELAHTLSEEFPSFDDPKWHQYNNAIEIKKTCNNWNLFPKATYDTFNALNSPIFLEQLSTLTGISPLLPDPGLNGGGWHIHANGGKLNPHLDYSMHPKLPYQRKLNIIIYLQKDWKEAWGGHLGLYTHDEQKQGPGKLVHEFAPTFNRALFFDTTQNSWHGLCKEVSTPPGICRKSMAAYYLTAPPKDVDTRAKALFAPTKEQEGNDEILDLIKKRSNINTADSTYRK